MVDSYKEFVDVADADVTVSAFITAVMWTENTQVESYTFSFFIFDLPTSLRSTAISNNEKKPCEDNSNEILTC